MLAPAAERKFVSDRQAAAAARHDPHPGRPQAMMTMTSTTTNSSARNSAVR